MAKQHKTDLWFRNKEYGWGWTPATWQGWTTLLFYFGVLVYASWVFLPHTRTEALEPKQLLAWLSAVLLVIINLMAIAWLKGERPQWHLGGVHVKHSKKR